MSQHHPPPAALAADLPMGRTKAKARPPKDDGWATLGAPGTPPCLSHKPRPTLRLPAPILAGARASLTACAHTRRPPLILP
jgi:hypothetical protein